MSQRFPGQYFDQESEMHYNLQRDYNPKIGRYLQGDPIGLWGGINLYGYAGQNPLGFIDSDGRNQYAAAFGAIAQLASWALRKIPKGQKKPQQPSLPLPPIPMPPVGKPETEPRDWNHNPGEECPGKGKLCLPPAGTKCYKGPHTTHSHNGLNPHYHFFKMNQAPDCTCRWNKISGEEGAASVPEIGVIECPFNSWGHH